MCDQGSDPTQHDTARPPSPEEEAAEAGRLQGEYGEAEPATDRLWPAGQRPRCLTCRERPVYLGGLCGPCYATAGEEARSGIAHPRD